MSEGPALRVDGERVSPDRFYATACDPARSVVVEACAGSGLRALGEGSVCEWCDVRGLCRRDDWQAEVQAVAERPGGDER